MFLTAIKLSLFTWFLGSAAYIHFRGRERMKLTRQITDFSTFLAPLNCLTYLFSSAPSTPYISTDRFPELAPLRENWKIIRDEAIALNDAGKMAAGEGLAFKSFYKDDRWKRFYLTWYGKDYETAQKFCPQTLQLIKDTPGINGALLVKLNPHKHLKRHRDPFALSLRYHLGLVTPNSDQCRLLVDGKSYSWADGDDVLFDETYVHEAMNNTDQERIILFCDVQRPMRGMVAKGFAKMVHRMIGFLTVANNEQGEHKSRLNEFVENVFYPFASFLKKIKRKNKRVYYWSKHAILVLLVVLILI